MTAVSTDEPGIRPGRAAVDGHGRGVVVKLLIRGPLAAWLASSVESTDSVRLRFVRPRRTSDMTMSKIRKNGAGVERLTSHLKSRCVSALLPFFRARHAPEGQPPCGKAEVKNGFLADEKADWEYVAWSVACPAVGLVAVWGVVNLVAWVWRAW